MRHFTRRERTIFAVTLTLSVVGVLVLDILQAHRLVIAGYVLVVQVAFWLMTMAAAGVAPRRLFLGWRLLPAMRRGEIVVHFQPLISLRTGEMVALEALARWEHPRKGLLGPAAWIEATELPWIERRFLRHTLRAALAQSRAWRDDFELEVHVNVTPSVFCRHGLDELVADELERAGATPFELVLELTENALELDQAGFVNADLLSNLGVGLALDDFGTGQSSLERLARLPVRSLKIDRRFVAPQLRSPRHAAIVRATIDLSHTLDLESVAEGVENEIDAMALHDYGCDIAQGYHFARPMPGDELLRSLRDPGSGLRARPLRFGSAPPAS